MILFPAIDLKNGRAVRLEQGDFSKETVYSTNPLDVAENFRLQGASWLHIVDLDGARTGEAINTDLVKKIIKQTGLKVQLGGGVRSLIHIEKWLDAGVERVIIGSAAVNNSEFVKEAVSLAGNRVAIGVDAKNGKVATHGWEKDSGIDSYAFCQTLEGDGVQTVIYTDIAKDGMLQGPNFDAYVRLCRETNLKIIASGGVASLADLTQLKAMNVHGAILGKSLYEQKFKLSEALDMI